MGLAYSVLTEPVVVQEEIKKSRFITYLAHTNGRDEAMAFVREIKQKHHDARHNCWAFVAGAPQNSMELGFSDDGEPGGTAGKPILAALQGSGIGEITAVVTRYSGGIKLGTGGLVRAYGGGVQAALKLVTLTEKTPQVVRRLCCDYQQMPLVEACLNQVAGKILQAEYGADVNVELSLDADKVATFSKLLIDRSQGRLQLEA